MSCTWPIVVHTELIMVIIPTGCEAKGLHVAHDMAAIERPRASCHFNRPSCFTGFNPWAGLYVPRGAGFCCNRYPKAEGSQQQQATNEKSSDNSPFVLSADEQACVQNIGGAIATFLKPYGINVDVGMAQVPKDGKCRTVLNY